MIQTDKPGIEQYGKQKDDTRTLKEINNSESAITIAAIDCTLPLARIYEGVAFNP